LLTFVRYKLAIFDFDGTLADSFSWLLDVSDQIADRYRFRRFDRADMEGLRGLGPRELLRRHDVPAWKLPFILRHGRQLMSRDIARVPLFPGVGAALAHLASRGVRLAIVSSNSRANVVTVLGAATAAHVSQLECGVSFFGKAAKLRQVLRRGRVAAHEALLIGDELRDAEAARHAQIAYGAVAWGYTRLEALLAAKPEAVFRTVEDLAALAE
jgi:phosphoglycolate phosphatase